MKQRSRFFLKFLILSFIGLHAQESREISLAILDFEGSKGVEKEQLQAITDRFQAAVIDAGGFRVLDRNQMEAVLQEQGFQQTVACNSSECQVQMGQLLGVDKLLSSKVVKIEDVWAISLRYLNVATGQVEKVFSYEVEGSLVDVLRDGARRGAVMLHDYAFAAPVKPVDTGVPRDQFQSQQVPVDALPKSAEKGLSAKRKFALALWGVSAAGIGAGTYFNMKGEDYRKDWEKANEDENARALDRAYDNTQDMKLYRNTSYAVSVVGLVAGCVLWFLPE